MIKRIPIIFHTNKLFLLVMLTLTLFCSKPEIPKVETKKNIEKQMVVIAKGGLKLRDKPGREGLEQVTIPQYQEIIYLEDSDLEETIDKIQAKWVKIKWNGYTGYSFGGFLKDSQGYKIPTPNILFAKTDILHRYQEEAKFSQFIDSPVSIPKNGFVSAYLITKEIRGLHQIRVLDSKKDKYYYEDIRLGAGYNLIEGEQNYIAYRLTLEPIKDRQVIETPVKNSRKQEYPSYYIILYPTVNKVSCIEFKRLSSNSLPPETRLEDLVFAIDINSDAKPDIFYFEANDEYSYWNYIKYKNPSGEWVELYGISGRMYAPPEPKTQKYKYECSEDIPAK